MILTIRSVLGDSREAQVLEPIDELSWFACPFCEYPVYMNGTRECGNPGCVANPAMPLDTARLARGRAILAEMEVQAMKARYAELAAGRREHAAAQHAEWLALEADCRARGACVDCCRSAWWYRRAAKFVRHRGACPRG